MTEKWDRFYLELAEFVALKLSRDPSTKVGAVLVNWQYKKEFIGYNGFPPLMGDSPERYADRPFKILSTVHAEINAISKAGDYSIGSTLYVWPPLGMPPICHDCAKQAMTRGVKEVVGYFPVEDEKTKRWAESIAHARLMFDEVGITYRGIQGPKPPKPRTWGKIRK